MSSVTRKHYIDNLRWMILLLLIPYHTAMAWNSWGEPNYIFFEGNKAISSIVVFLSPYFMPVLFVLSGISTKFALQKRSGREYLSERVRKLLIPLIFGTVVLMPVLCYIGDKFNHSYDGGFFSHYAVFFTKFTDLTGADGGFSFGQFWFLLYLSVISLVCLGVLKLSEKRSSDRPKPLPFLLVILLGIPLPLLGELLSIGGKSLAEFAYLFLVGYFVFTDDETIKKAEKYRLLMLGIGITSSVFNVYLFLWSDRKFELLNNITDCMSEWFMIIALVGTAKRHFNFSNRITDYIKSRSFLLYIYHFIWVVSAQYLLYKLFGNNTRIIFPGTLLISYPMTFICCEISIRIPFMCFLTGTKCIPLKKKTD